MAMSPQDAKPTIAGVLDIIAGAMSLVGSGVFVVIAVVISRTINLSGHAEAEVLSALPLAILLPLALFGVIVGLVAVVGGAATLRRRRFGLAVAGAVAALFAFFPVGIPALILTVLSQKDFGNS